MEKLLDFLNNKNKEYKRHSNYDDETLKLKSKIENWNEKNIEKFSIDFKSGKRKTKFLYSDSIFGIKRTKELLKKNYQLKM